MNTLIYLWTPMSTFELYLVRRKSKVNGFFWFRFFFIRIFSLILLSLGPINSPSWNSIKMLIYDYMNKHLWIHLNTFVHLCTHMNTYVHLSTLLYTFEHLWVLLNTYVVCTLLNTYEHFCVEQLWTIIHTYIHLWFDSQFGYFLRPEPEPNKNFRLVRFGLEKVKI